MTLEASFTKCQGLCSFQEHFPQKVGQCLKPASTPSHCIYVRIHSKNAFFMRAGQRLSSPDIKECNNWVNNDRSGFHADKFWRKKKKKKKSPRFLSGGGKKKKKFCGAVCIVTPQNFPSFKFYSQHLHRHYHHHHHHH